jgi:outer membrane lipoprotein-sorting protein
MTWGAAPAGAAPPDALALVKQMKAALEPSRPSVRSLTLVVSAHQGEDAHWTAAEARKTVGGHEYILMVLLAPEDVKGIAWLVQQGKNSNSDTEWFYMPTIRRTRKLMGPDAYEAFLGSDFTHADLGFESVSGTFKVLGSGTHDGAEAYQVEVIPRDRWYYQRIVTWVNAGTKLPMERTFYDTANALWKVELFDQVTTIDGTPTPLRIRMENRQTGDTSEIRVTAVRYNADIPDALFDPARIATAASASVWQGLAK